MFGRTPGGAYRAPEQVLGIRDPKVTELVDAERETVDEARPGDISLSLAKGG